MAEMTLSAQLRSDFGSAAARRVRRNGLVPAIVYGGSDANVAVSLDPREIIRVLRSEAGRNTIVSLRVPGSEAHSVILRDWQVDPVRDTILHADFQRIAMDQLLTLTVPVAIHGEASGVKAEGGLLEVVLREIEVECLPADIPERIDCDVTHLKMNEALRVRDLPGIDRVEILADPDRVIVHVVAVKEEEVAAVEEEGVEAALGEGEAAEGEPEVAARGKKEESEEEGGQ
jgi:large subunit ribosomal protein L25